ncbi:hypothetical protein [Streptomyces sp. NPDC048665]|uniref:hypothetical protein n=1 Tax=Streptomyces sp. NPDC048665 TaxID=3155490 RepID=UPI00344AA410
MAEPVDREFFTRDLGPWPMWVWILAGVSGMYLWERFKGGSSGTKTAGQTQGQKAPAGTSNQDQTVNDGTVGTAPTPTVFVLPQGVMSTGDAVTVQGSGTGNSGVNSGNPPGSSGNTAKPRPGASNGTSA